MSPGETPAPTPSIWVMDGDRTRKDPELWNVWSEAFHGEEPHNIYMVDVDETANICPFLCPKMRTKLASPTTPQECGRAMLNTLLSKGWLPKCAIPEEEAMPVLEHIKTTKEHIKTNKADKKILKKYLEAFAASKVVGDDTSAVSTMKTSKISLICA